MIANNKVLSRTIVEDRPLADHVRFTPVKGTKGETGLNGRVKVSHGKAAYIKDWVNNPMTLKECQQRIQCSEATGYGIILGNGIVAIDFDGLSSIKIAGAIGQWLVEAVNDTLAWSSGKAEGYYQVAFLIPEKHLSLWEKVGRKDLKEYGDVKGDNGDHLEIRYNKTLSVLPPSWHSGELYYQWINETEMKTLSEYQSQCLLYAISKHNAQNSKLERELSDEQEKRLVLEALKHISSDDYDVWIDVGMTLKHGGYSLQIWDEWSSRSPKYISGECESKWKSFNKSGKTIASLFWIAENHGFDQKQWMRENLTPKSNKHNSLSKSANSKGKNNKNTAEKPDAITQGWTIFEEHYQGRLKFNELSNFIELDGEEPELDLMYLELKFNHGLIISKNIAYDLAVRFAKEHPYNPVKDYLESIKDTTIPPNISLDHLASRYFGTTEPFYDLALKLHLIASIARIIEPGCKKDEVLILFGKQGSLKSTFWETLYGKDYFTDSVSGTDKDNLLKLHSHWCCELAEIETITNKKEAGELKAFLSANTDCFREPYGKSSRRYKRKSIFVGSVNKESFLLDETGSRRFPVIPVAVERIDIGQLKQERDYIWALAYQAYLNGERWWFNETETEYFQKLNESYHHDDSWEEIISENLDDVDCITSRDVLIEYLKFEESKIKKGDEMRVCNILNKLGWKKTEKKVVIQGKRARYWEKT